MGNERKKRVDDLINRRNVTDNGRTKAFHQIYQHFFKCHSVSSFAFHPQ